MKPKYLSLNPLIHWKEDRHPIIWKNHFGKKGPLAVEIGFGLGDYLIRLAIEQPDTHFIGIEPEWFQIKRLLRKIALSETTNVKILQADARLAFERLFTQKSVGRIFSLFPCPWPKKKHEKYRLFSTDFLKVLNSRLVENGELMVVTDDRIYCDWILNEVPGSDFEVRTEKIPPRFFTKYEKKWANLGQKYFFQLRLSKSHHKEMLVKEDVILRTHRIAHFEAQKFKPSPARGKMTVEFKEFLYDPSREKGMVRTIVVEDTLKQHLWIDITKGKAGWHIKPSKGCNMIPTVGVQLALDLVRDAASDK